MIGAWSRNPCNSHIAIAARFDFLYSVSVSQTVEFAEQLIKALDNFVSLHPRRNFAESDDVGEEHGGVVVVIGNVAFAVSKPEGNLSRKNISQQGFGMSFLLFDSREIVGFHSPQGIPSQCRPDARSQDVRIERFW